MESPLIQRGGCRRPTTRESPTGVATSKPRQGTVARRWAPVNSRVVGRKFIRSELTRQQVPKCRTIEEAL
ncbi:hypothetical protein FHR95_002214 [Halomonas fontilapidosi]|uniref:Uncharacterized protein n=1 Tax=Halomonas fontilapidosi TaxID=616675 RepID=A0A7W5GZF7_9GAMM|nr:hypothetical protein [Halomonas fontilapidosi]MBB3184640.1 hypothetical protein [Halomonas fontilapidosi]